MNTEQLEQKIKVLFDKEGIGACSERFLSTIRFMYPDDNEYIKQLIIRLRQGGEMEEM